MIKMSQTIKLPSNLCNKDCKDKREEIKCVMTIIMIYTIITILVIKIN